MTVIRWIESDHRQYKPFVGHRIAEILESTNESNWRYVPTAENVDDYATRAKDPTSSTRRKYDASPYWICNRRFSFFELLQNETSTCIRQTIYPQCEERRPTIRKTNEIQKAENDQFRMAQTDVFSNECKLLKQKRNIDPKSSIYKLLPYLDENNILRMSGRADAASILTLDTRKPIILPRNHAITDLIFDDHREMRHQNQDAVVCAMRKRFWIPQLKSLVKKRKNECGLCKKNTCRQSY